MYNGCGVHVEELDKLSMQFASEIPEQRLTPADIQGFLITRETPALAISEVAAWVKAEIALKDTGRIVSKNV